MAPRKLAAGNWKMNGTTASLAEVDALTAPEGCGVLICPPATLIAAMAAQVQGGVMVGGQDCHAKASGAHTGDISAAQLKDAGASHVILGHSERRADHGETDAQVAAKAGAAHGMGLTAIICVGETDAQRDAGETLDVIARQLAGSVPEGASAGNTVIAYEPVWAIGSGRTPTAEQIAEVHALMRERLSARFEDGADMTLLYGGSVKASNAREIFAIAHVNGALVGGASLKAADFAPIVAALAAA
ncbi:triose-phosphate isomerase [Paracoccus sp. S-4012]|uniref:triose-phosphate isomerase n=1 Tax=Paracoccus sp. S-4012 TaxID=2665648 RepID=UPI0012B152F3|nr:triose-phosphate isomerase [Paracoccus sp. S-4012]MRX50331.1 triose-phosphate isomerase [Paracoccus sp. S-4012]